MLIAVRPYGNMDLTIGDEILIFMPETMEVRWMPIRQAFSIGIERSSFHGTEYSVDSIYKCLRGVNISEFKFRFMNLTRGCDNLVLDNEVSVNIEMPYVRADEQLAVNDTPVYDGLAYADILYVYRYCDYYVIRMIITYMDCGNKFFTVILSKQGTVIDYWLKGSYKSGLSMKIDTLMRY